MARISDRGLVPHSHHPRYKSAPGEIASRIYPDLAAPDDLAVARWRRQAFNNDLRYVDHVLRNGVDVGDEQLPTQPRRQSTDAQKAYALWGRQMQQEANEAAQQDIRQRWHDFYMESSIFERKRR